MSPCTRLHVTALAGTFVLCCSSEPEITGGTGAAPPGESETSSGGSSGQGAGQDAGFTFAIPDAGPLSAGSAESTCGAMKFELAQSTPELVVVLDRSGSMTSKVAGGTRWSETSAAVQATVMATDAGVLWGLKLFPSGAGRCSVLDGVEVDVAPRNFPRIGPRVTGTPPDKEGGTPTDRAVRLAATYLRTLTSKNPKYLLLATDGQPTCRNDDPEQENPLGALTAIAEAAEAGFHTFVVGLATFGTKAHDTLNLMAEAGRQPRAADPKYYAVANRRDLVAALDTITGKIATCAFRLDRPPPAPDNVKVLVGDSPIAADPSRQDGWSYGPDRTFIELHGRWCEALKGGGTRRVEIIYGCPGLIIP